MIRLAVSLGLLATLAWWLDLSQVTTRLSQLRLSWVLAALALTVFQVIGSAWRWSYTARRLGLDLPFWHAVREYYLAVFLNQLLPGGVLGDVSRAWRHAQVVETGPAVRAVVLERAVGQVVMVMLTVGSGFILVSRDWHEGGQPNDLLLALALAGLAGASIWMYRRRHARRSSIPWPAVPPGAWTRWSATSWLGELWQDARQAVFSRPALGFQLATSISIALSFLLTYVFVARAVGIETPIRVLVPLIPPVLMSMVIPITVAGWGIREGTAGVLWTAAGLSAADGVALSLAYGVIVFLSTLPGGVLLARVGGQVHIKKNVLTEPKVAASWPQRVAERRDRE